MKLYQSNEQLSSIGHSLDKHIVHRFYLLFTRWVDVPLKTRTCPMHPFKEVELMVAKRQQTKSRKIGSVQIQLPQCIGMARIKEERLPILISGYKWLVLFPFSLQIAMSLLNL